MKKNYLFSLICLTLLTTNKIQCQVTFDSQVSGTIQDLESISLRQITSTTYELWTCGTGGTILHSSDLGANWGSQSSTVTATLNDITFASSTDGWACGSSGTIVSTQNGGTSWGVQSQGAPYSMNTIYMHSITNGIVLGDQFFVKTSTGGDTWSSTTTDFNVTAVDFISSSTGFACGSGGAIYKTTDGGSIWVLLTTPTNAFLQDIFFISDTEGWACGYSGIILHTIDGGVNWSIQTNPMTSVVAAIKFFDSQNGWACGYSGIIYHTRDGGTNWTLHTSGYTGTTFYLRDIELISATEGIAVGENGSIIHFEDNTDYTGLTETTKTQISIFPNPSSNILNISTSKPSNVYVQNIEGKTIERIEIISESNIDISNYQSGIYFIKSEDGETIKFIKQ